MPALDESPWHTSRKPTQPLQTAISAGTVIVGAGIAGLHLARALAEHGEEVVVVESGRLGCGASGRNAGFLLADGATPHATVESNEGTEVANAVRALGGRTREIAADLHALHSIELRQCGSLRLAGDQAEADELRATVTTLGVPLRFVERDDLPAPWRDKGFRGAAEDPHDGVMNPMAFLEATRECADAAGARLFERSSARAIQAGPHGVDVITETGRVSGDRVVLALNAWTRKLSRIPIHPARAQMLEALVDPAPRWPQPVYTRGGADYWRDLGDGRILLGGCRDAGGAAEACDDARPSDVVQAALDGLLRSLVPETSRVQVTRRWAGLMGFTPDERPVAGPIDDTLRIHTLAGFNGHGMGWAPALAEALAEQLKGVRSVPASFASERFNWV